MKSYTDKKRRLYPFNVVNKIWLKLHPYRQHSVEHRKYQKLSKKWYGPFEIIKRGSEVAFRLKLLEGSTIFPVFHAALLKPFKGTETGETKLELPPLAVDTHPLAWPEKIWKGRIIVKQGRKVQQLLVSWKGLPTEETSWEDLDFLKQLMPDSNLWGQQSKEPGG